MQPPGRRPFQVAICHDATSGSRSSQPGYARLLSQPLLQLFLIDLARSAGQGGVRAAVRSAQKGLNDLPCTVSGMKFPLTDTPKQAGRVRGSLETIKISL